MPPSASNGPRRSRCRKRPRGPTSVIVRLRLGFAAATFLYMTSSDRYHIAEAGPGGLVATVIWLLLVKGFQVYLHFANPGSAYGAASSLLVFLVFLYLASIGLILGAMVTAVIVRNSVSRQALAQGGS